jgi:hypothetical protein
VGTEYFKKEYKESSIFIITPRVAPLNKEDETIIMVKEDGEVKRYINDINTIEIGNYIEDVECFFRYLISPENKGVKLSKPSKPSVSTDISPYFYSVSTLIINGITYCTSINFRFYELLEGLGFPIYKKNTYEYYTLEEVKQFLNLKNEKVKESNFSILQYEASSNDYRIYYQKKKIVDNLLNIIWYLYLIFSNFHSKKSKNDDKLDDFMNNTFEVNQKKEEEPSYEFKLKLRLFPPPNHKNFRTYDDYKLYFYKNFEKDIWNEEENKLILHNETFYNNIKLWIDKYRQNHTDNIKISNYQFLTDYYNFEKEEKKGKHDIIIGNNELRMWKYERNLYFNYGKDQIYLKFNGTKNIARNIYPVFYQQFNMIFIIQNNYTGDITNACEISYYWSKNKINLGYNERISNFDSDVLKEFRIAIYGVRNNQLYLDRVLKFKNNKFEKVSDKINTTIDLEEKNLIRLICYEYENGENNINNRIKTVDWYGSLLPLRSSENLMEEGIEEKKEIFEVDYKKKESKRKKESIESEESDIEIEESEYKKEKKEKNKRKNKSKESDAEIEFIEESENDIQIIEPKIKQKKPVKVKTKISYFENEFPNEEYYYNLLLIAKKDREKKERERKELNENVSTIVSFSPSFSSNSVTESPEYNNSVYRYNKGPPGYILLSTKGDGLCLYRSVLSLIKNNNGLRNNNKKYIKNYILSLFKFFNEGDSYDKNLWLNDKIGVLREDIEGYFVKALLNDILTYANGDILYLISAKEKYIIKVHMKNYKTGIDETHIYGPDYNKEKEKNDEVTISGVLYKIIHIVYQEENHYSALLPE